MPVRYVRRRGKVCRGLYESTDGPFRFMDRLPRETKILIESSAACLANSIWRRGLVGRPVIKPICREVWPARETSSLYHGTLGVAACPPMVSSRTAAKPIVYYG